MHVIGTAGHVDHGKSSLLRVLTGMEPSRLAEERARGMTMQLGYVHFTGADGKEIGIVDVPGHADYRMHTLTGASAIDAFLFICACDDGWMPQSEEHLFALASYGIRHGVVVLTKRDLIDATRFEALKNEMEVRFFEAVGRELPVVGFSAPTSAGIVEVKAALTRELAEIAQTRDLGRPQMFVDRVFTVAGQGTVVTGTLREGSMSERQVIEVLPSRKKTQVRSLQSYGQKLTHVRPTSRVALQVANLGVGDIPKDSQLADPAHVWLTATIDCKMQMFRDYRINPKKSPEVMVVHGGVKTKGTLIPMVATAAEGAPGSDWLVRIKLETQRLIRFSERVLIISSGTDRVLGAGVVLDEAPATSVTVAIPLLREVRGETLLEYLALNVGKTGFVRRRDIVRRTRFMPDDVDEVVREHSDLFAFLDDWITEPGRVDIWHASLLEEIAKFHRKNPTEEGVAESALAKATRLEAELLHMLLKLLKKEGKLQQVGPYLKTFGFVPKVDRTSEVAAQLEALAADPAAAVRSMFELGVDGEEKRKVLNRFIADGKFVRMDEKHVMAAAVYAELSGKVQTLMREKGGVSAAEVRDHLQIGRKVVIMLLEAMDHAKVTFRDGETRRLVGGNS